MGMHRLCSMDDHITMIFVPGFLNAFICQNFANTLGNHPERLSSCFNLFQSLFKNNRLGSAIREVGEVRFLPIVLTSLTAIGGLMPIALSTNPLIAPLAIVLIGGLISSTLLSRAVTPVVYKLIPPAVKA